MANKRIKQVTEYLIINMYNGKYFTFANDSRWTKSLRKAEISSKTTVNGWLSIARENAPCGLVVMKPVIVSYEVVMASINW